MEHVINTIRALRAQLHELAERSGCEKKTKAHLMAFLREHTSLGIVDEGQWFCAIHKETGACNTVACDTIAFRADMDAVPADIGAAHRCGHDGHCAALAGLGLLLEGKKVGRNVVLIFQHAEETGEGGKICARAMEKYGVARIYALHNIPRFKESAVLLRKGIFACASRGMRISLTGTAAHAAYPEFGRNPGFAAARLISLLPELTGQKHYKGLTMATLVGADIGTKAFGTAAARAELRLTLRAYHEEDLAALIGAVEKTARAEAACDGVDVAITYSDIFPATVNDGGLAATLCDICRRQGLDTVEVPEPFRWSEDFGWYGQYAKALMAGIGAGESWPSLHAEDYTFNDELLPPMLKLLQSLAIGG